MAGAIKKIQLSGDFSVYANPSAKMEAEFIYKEIFIDKCYDVANFPDDAFMVDAGANIGMFSLYMKKKFPSSTILAFEPAPNTFNTLKRNLELHKASGVQAHQCGLGRENGSLTLTFYPNMPGNSTLYSEDKEMQFENLDKEHPVVKLLAESEKVQVEVKRLSDVLSQQSDIRRIDLLKVDVEGAELDVLEGLDDAHWALIDNIAMEICDSKGDFIVIKDLLHSKGFQISTETVPWAPKDLPMYMLIARRV